MKLNMMTRAEVLERIESEVRKAGSAKNLAAAWSISAPYLSDVRKGVRAPGPSILVRLGLEAETQYAPREKSA